MTSGNDYLIVVNYNISKSVVEGNPAVELKYFHDKEEKRKGTEED